MPESKEKVGNPAPGQGADKKKPAKVKVKVSASQGRRRKARIRAESAFGNALKSLLKEAGLTRPEFARRLTAETGENITSIKLGNWMDWGVSPKQNAMRDKILDAARKVAATEEQVDEERLRVPPETIKAQFEAWYKEGMSPKQVRIAAELTASQFADWESGRAQVTGVQFAAVQQRVEHWLDVLKNRGVFDRKPAKAVQAQMAAWRRAGLTDTDIRRAAEMSPGAFRDWTSGTTDIPLAAFERVQMMVDHWLDVISERKAWADKYTEELTARLTTDLTARLKQELTRSVGSGVENLVETVVNTDVKEAITTATPPRPRKTPRK